MSPDQVSAFAEALTAWGDEQPTWRALALVGSWARGQARPDSDLDILIVTTEMQRWIASSSWLEGLGSQSVGLPTGASTLEHYGVARSWRLWFGPQIEIEATLVDLDWANHSPVDEGTRRVIAGGIQVLRDKDGVLEELKKAVGAGN